MNTTTNPLYPIFLKAHQLNMLIVGGGNVGLEKLSFLLKSSPQANVMVMAPWFSEELKTLAEAYHVPLVQRSYASNVLHKKHIVIAATNDTEVNKQIYHDCKRRDILVNVADTPDYCDFYLGGIVTKGNVKVAISTNGKSPTTAKRLRQFFEEVIPDNINELVENLHRFRKTLKGDFEYKVKRLNEQTKSLVE